MFVPECTPDGVYKRLQFTIADGVTWCVDEITGEEINGTRNSGHGSPVPKCPGKEMSYP